jgi:anti-sigma B factor antagonist
VPYLTCPQCAATVYSAARWSSVDCCPRCESELRSDTGLVRKTAAVKRALECARTPKPAASAEERLLAPRESSANLMRELCWRGGEGRAQRDHERADEAPLSPHLDDPCACRTNGGQLPFSLRRRGRTATTASAAIKKGLPSRCVRAWIFSNVDRYWRFPLSSLAAFRVTVEPIEDATLIRVVGEIDATTADQLRTQLDDARQSGETTLLDLASVNFVDSVGLRVLLEATEKVNSDDWALFIVRPSRVVRRLLEITDTADRLPVVPVAEASA